MEAILRPLQAEIGAAHDYFKLMGNPVRNKPIDRQRPRNPVYQRQHIGGEGILQLGTLIEVIQNHLGNRIPLEHNHETLPGAVRGFIANIRNPLDLSIFHQSSDFCRQIIRIDLVGKFGNHQADPGVDFLYVDYGSLHNGTATGTVCLFNPFAPQNSGARGEIRSLNPFDQGFH